MNERIRIVIDHMRTHTVLPLRNPVQALEISGPGRSVLVALWFGTAPEGDAALACGVALLAILDAPFCSARLAQLQGSWGGNLLDSRSLPDDCQAWRRSSIISSERASLQGRAYF